MNRTQGTEDLRLIAREASQSARQVTRDGEAGRITGALEDLRSLDHAAILLVSPERTELAQTRNREPRISSSREHARRQ